MADSLFEIGLERQLSLNQKRLHVCQEEHQIQLALIGNLEPRKSQFETIQAVEGLIRENNNIHLRFYGATHFYPEYFVMCEKYVTSRELQGRITFHGNCSNIDQVMREMDMVLSLSTYGSFSGSIGEAMAAGVLVVATPVGGISELIINGVSGVLCRDVSVEALADGSRRALALSPEDRHKITKHARGVAKTEVHPHRCAVDLFTMYNRAIDLTSGRNAIQPIVRPVLPHEAYGVDLVDYPHYPPSGKVRVCRKSVYHLRPKHSDWMGLDMMIGTHQRPAKGMIKLRVFGENGQLVRETCENVAEVRDNDWLNFRFSPIANSASISFSLEFRLLKAGRQTRISFYESSSQEGRMHRILRRAGFLKLGNELYCRMVYRR